MSSKDDLDENDLTLTAIHRNRKTRRFENSLRARKRRRKLKMIRMSKIEKLEE